jgi:tRNA (cytosine49-C5)-methyltransferase
MMRIKQSFQEKYSQLTDWEKYKKTILQFRRKSIRVNTLKTSVVHARNNLLDQGWALTPIPWCKEGFYIEGERRDIGNLEEHKRGDFFIQRSTSMLPALVLHPTGKDKVLDMCAAPGGKTTHLAALMKNKGSIVANEPFRNRVKELHINLDRCGVKNVVVTTQPGEKITGVRFDKILVDAPCSNSGSLKGNTKKSAEIMKLWSVKRVKRYAKLQKKLLLHAYELLKPKGVVVYATCSLDPEEDEDVVDYVVKKTGATLEKINLPVKAADKKYFKIWPQYQNTDGFFVAKLHKK